MEYLEFEFNISPIIPYREIVIAYLADSNFESFIDTDSGLKAYVQKGEYKEEWKPLVNELVSDDVEIVYNQNKVENKNWNAEWESNFQPIIVEDVIIKAPFHNIDKNYLREILIQPQMSFGTGHHQTTFLMIKELKEMDVEGLSVLDMGCGTGVLAILAAMKKAKIVDAIDVDKWAFNNTKDNLKLNQVSNVNIMLGDASLLNSQQYDIVLANINKNILLADIPKYTSTLKKGGHLLLSGFYTTDVEEITLLTNKLGYKIKNQLEKDNWTVLHLIYQP